MVPADRRPSPGPASIRLPLWSLKELGSHCPQLSPLNLGAAPGFEAMGTLGESRLGLDRKLGTVLSRGQGGKAALPP